MKGVILRSYNLRCNIGGFIPDLWAQLLPFPQNPKHDLVKKFTKIYYHSILGYFVGYMIYYMLPWSRKVVLQPTICYYTVCCTFVEHVKYHAQTTEVFCLHFRYCFLIFMMKVAMFIERCYIHVKHALQRTNQIILSLVGLWIALKNRQNDNKYWSRSGVTT